MFGSSNNKEQPILIVKAGSTLDSLELIKVNSKESISIKTNLFEGLINVRIKDFRGPNDSESINNPKDDFSNKEGATWSILVHGRFLNETKTSDLLWGNIWANPIRNYLPPGLSIITKYLEKRDPTIKYDLYSDTPFAFSPWLSTTQFVNIVSHPSESSLLTLDSTSAVEEDVTNLFTSHESNQLLFGTDVKELEKWKGEPSFRKDFMGDQSKSNQVVLSKDMVTTAEFAHGHIDFSTLSIKLPLLPSLPLAKYWDGQPITFVLRNQSTQQDYLYVTFEIGQEVEDEEEEEKEEVKNDDVD